MLLRVDVYPSTLPSSGEGSATNNNNSIGQEQQQPKSVKIKPSNTVYVSLNNSNGGATILTVGRKDSTIVLPTDKSVSRKHFSITLVSKENDDDDDDDEDRKTNHPEKASSSEEIEACENSDTGMIAIIKDSSRFGTFIITESDGKKHEKKPKNDDDSETGDDETDDEGGGGNSQQQQQSQLSAISKRILTTTTTTTTANSSYNVSKIQKPMILHSLSSMDNTANNIRDRRVVIQCGQNGSTLVISRVALNVVFSRVPKATKDVWMYSRGPKLGLNIIEESIASPSSRPLTCLVTHPNRITNAKSLVAWCLQKPMVTLDYLDAIWDFSSQKSGDGSSLPDPKDYPPPPGDDETFWDIPPNSKLWSHCTLLSYNKGDDMESLCRAAGCSVKSIPNNNIKDAIQFIDDILSSNDDNDDNNEGYFYIPTSTKKLSKLMKHLKKCNFSAVTQKLIALCISQQEPLKDVHDKIIGIPNKNKNNVIEEEVVVVEDKKEEQKEDEIVVIDDDEGETPQKDTGKKPKATPTRSSRRRKQTSPSPSPKKQHANSSSVESPLPAKKNTQSSLNKSNDDNIGTQWIDSQRSTTPMEEDSSRSNRSSSRSSRTACRRKRQRESQRGAGISDDEDDENNGESFSSNSQKKPRTDAEDTQETTVSKKKKKGTTDSGGWTSVHKNKYNDDDDDLEVIEEGSHRKKNKEYLGKREKLPKTKDGWLISAGKDRTKFKATEAELLDAIAAVTDDDDLPQNLPPTAETVVRKDLVVKAKSQQRKNSKNNKRSNNNVIDYKGFRKNSIILPQQRRPDIQMRVVLPKQSERQDQLQQEQAQLEAQLREAELLFSDRNNNITSHFKKNVRRRGATGTTSRARKSRNV